MTGRRGPGLAECNGCTLPIRFVRLNTGKAVPVNPRPDPAGTVAARLVGGRLHGRMIHADDPPTEVETRYVVHFATCENRQPKPKTSAPDPDAPLF